EVQAIWPFVGSPYAGRAEELGQLSWALRPALAAVRPGVDKDQQAIHAHQCARQSQLLPAKPQALQPAGLLSHMPFPVDPADMCDLPLLRCRPTWEYGLGWSQFRLQIDPLLPLPSRAGYCTSPRSTETQGPLPMRWQPPPAGTTL